MNVTIDLADPRAIRSRERLVAAITTLLETADPADLTVTRVVAVAGLTKPTFYQHFADLGSVARAAALARLDAILPREPQVGRVIDEPADTLRESMRRVEATVRDVLIHLREHAVFYRRVMQIPGAINLYREIVTLLADRLALHSPLGRPIAQAATPAGAADLAAVLAAGLTHLAIDWLDGDPSAPDAVDRMTIRVTTLLGAVLGRP